MDLRKSSLSYSLFPSESCFDFTLAAMVNMVMLPGPELCRGDRATARRFYNDGYNEVLLTPPPRSPAKTLS